MKAFSPALGEHVAGRVTTLCNCWRVMRRDGTVLGFTDHDRTLSFDGVDHEPETGFDASAATTHAGLQVGGLEVTGAFRSERITEADLAAGFYDNARVETWLVNWNAPEARHLMRVGHIGEVRREGDAFTAEIRGLAHLLDQERGRFFRFTCDADLGDGRCRVDLEAGGFSAEAAVLWTDGRRMLRATIPGERGSGFFDGGLLTFTSGACVGSSAEILRHERGEADDLIELWQPSSADIAVGDLMILRAGCDKHFATCRDRFSNQENFRGFPHMPGNDFALSYARDSDTNDGGRLRE